MMKYKNAVDVLPDKLLREIQKYASGEVIYVPRAEEKRGWGVKSGARSYYEKRNAEICARYAAGENTELLAASFNLSEASIRKIVYAGRGKAEEDKGGFR